VAQSTLKSGTALQANYGVRITGGGAAALIGEVHFLASPLRDIASSQSGASRDFATIYIAPGIRVKFAPEARISPYLAVGGGYALYEQSTLTLGGQANSAPRHIHRGLLQFGEVWTWASCAGSVSASRCAISIPENPRSTSRPLAAVCIT